MIFVVGSLNYDVTLYIDRMPEEHEKLSGMGRFESCGGSAANTAYWLACYGMKVAMFGAIGDDLYGRAAVTSLESAGVDCRGVQCLRGAQTRLQVILIGRDSKRMIGTGTAGNQFDPIALTTCDFVPGSLLHFTARDFDKIGKAVEQARRSGAIVSCELNGKDCRPILPFVDYAFMNEDEMRRTIGAEDPMGAIEMLAKQAGAKVVVTQGKAGAVLLGEQDRISRSTLIIEPVDRTGGGDAFNAGFLYAVMTGEHYGAAIERGLTLARAVISAKGARPTVQPLHAT